MAAIDYAFEQCNQDGSVLAIALVQTAFYLRVKGLHNFKRTFANLLPCRHECCVVQPY